MELMNGHQNNEKMLFHGTREESISHINQNGFNRSYAGKNGIITGMISVLAFAVLHQPLWLN